MRYEWKMAHCSIKWTNEGICRRGETKTEIESVTLCVYVTIHSQMITSLSRFLSSSQVPCLTNSFIKKLWKIIHQFIVNLSHEEFHHTLFLDSYPICFGEKWRICDAFSWQRIEASSFLEGILNRKISDVHRCRSGFLTQWFHRSLSDSQVVCGNYIGDFGHKSWQGKCNLSYFRDVFPLINLSRTRPFFGGFFDVIQNKD